MSDSAIYCHGLSIAQGLFAMENVQLELKKGYITGLIGRNGFFSIRPREAFE